MDRRRARPGSAPWPRDGGRGAWGARQPKVKSLRSSAGFREAQQKDFAVGPFDFHAARLVLEGQVRQAPAIQPELVRADGEVADLVLAGLDVQEVDEGVLAVAARQDVVVGAPAQQVVGRAAFQRVVAVPPEELVALRRGSGAGRGAGARHDRIVAVARHG